MFAIGVFFDLFSGQKLKTYIWLICFKKIFFLFSCIKPFISAYSQNCNYVNMLRWGGEGNRTKESTMLRTCRSREAMDYKSFLTCTKTSHWDFDASLWAPPQWPLGLFTAEASEKLYYNVDDIILYCWPYDNIIMHHSVE